MNDYKKRVLDAINRSSIKQLKLLNPKRKNQKPEKLVETECLLWMRDQSWDVDIYESKATYNPMIGRYVSQSMKAGVCDCMGMSSDGFAVYIEFKAKGKLSSFSKDSNERQREFLISKINFGAFACVVDSAQLLEAYYIQWLKRRAVDVADAKEFLFEKLPRRKKQNPLTF